MIRNGDHSNDATDVTVINLSDRRKITALQAQVADLEAKLAEASSVVRPALTKKLHTECYHQGVFEVADHELEVTCQVCGAKMDPYEVLRKIAHREVNFAYTMNHLRKERDTLTRDIERLKSKLSRLKTATRRETPDMSLDHVADCMESMGATRLTVAKVSGEWGVWFHDQTERKLLASGSERTLRGAATAAIESLGHVVGQIPDLGA